MKLITIPVFEKGDKLLVTKRLEIIPVFLTATPGDILKIVSRSGNGLYYFKLYCSIEKVWHEETYSIRFDLDTNKSGYCEGYYGISTDTTR